jgi:RimJ/RimL family protein N-acetyltransferase
MDYRTFGQSENTWYQLAVTDKRNGALLGDLAVHILNSQTIEVGYTIAPDNQRQGIAFEALSALLEYLAEQLKADTIHAFVDIENRASIGLLEKCGFRRVATFTANPAHSELWGNEYCYQLKY